MEILGAKPSWEHGVAAGGIGLPTSAWRSCGLLMDRLQHRNDLLLRQLHK